MIRRPPRSTRTDTLFPYTTLFRSLRANGPGTLGLCVLLRGFEGFVEGGFADLEARGGLANCEAGSDMFARLAELVSCDHWPPPPGATSLASGIGSCMGAILDQRSDERSVGKAVVSTGSMRVSAYNYKKKMM